MRCFISIELPEDVKNELAKIQAELPKENTKFLLVKPENIHLTLKFLGELDDSEVNNVKETLKGLKFSKFTARLNAIGIFPSPSFIRVVWVGLEPKSEFIKIHDLIDSELEKKGFRKDKVWENHATLTRVKWLGDREGFMKSLSGIKIKPIEFDIDNITLRKSTLTKEGPVYEDVIKVNL